MYTFNKRSQQLLHRLTYEGLKYPVVVLRFGCHLSVCFDVET